jgi:hypothetical protein
MLVMLNEKLLKLLTTIKNASKHNLLNWRKAGSFTYESDSSDGQILHIEKYFYGQDQSPCINFTIFDSNKTNILTETVRCKDGIHSEEFEALQLIYDIVESGYQKKESEQFSPVLINLTKSLEDKLANS